MPSKSKDQHKLMAAIANNPKFAKATKIPQSVGKEFIKADNATGIYKPRRNHRLTGE